MATGQSAACGDATTADVGERWRGHLAVPTAAVSAVVVRRWIREFLDQHCAAEDWGEELVLAVSEAFSNVVRHGTGWESDFTRLSIRATEEGIFLEIVYFGEPFDTRVWGLPNDIFEHRGRGRFLMRQLLDREEYVFANGITRLRMFKRF